MGQMGGDGGGGDGGGGELNGEGGGGEDKGDGAGDGLGVDAPGVDAPEITGSDSMVMPSAAEAEAAEPRVDRRRASSKGEGDTRRAMVAVMTTLPAETLMLTRFALTPAAAANLLRRAEVSA